MTGPTLNTRPPQSIALALHEAATLAKINGISQDFCHLGPVKRDEFALWLLDNVILPDKSQELIVHQFAGMTLLPSDLPGIVVRSRLPSDVPPVLTN